MSFVYRQESKEKLVGFQKQRYKRCGTVGMNANTTDQPANGNSRSHWSVGSPHETRAVRFFCVSPSDPRLSQPQMANVEDPAIAKAYQDIRNDKTGLNW
jgi:hypothetical protein